MQVVLKNCQKMGQLIDDLLEFSRLGRKELALSKVSMKEIVSHLVDDQRRLVSNKQFDIKIHELPNAVADAPIISQVWANLISNAIKYSMNKEKIMIEIGSVEKDHEPTYYVKDNGAGFDMKYYNKLFGVFQRLHSESEFKGTGVGLAIVHRIISKHRGKIWADAKVNEGATFFFTVGNHLNNLS
jgi:light-regulated signal transduction histidine kinase (bacteriophytochrome)